jgi:hypothetical protein
MSLGNSFDEPTTPATATATITEPAADAGAVVQIQSGTRFRVAGRVRWTPGTSLFVSKVKVILFQTATASGVTTQAQLDSAGATIDSRIDAIAEIHWHSELGASKGTIGRAVVRAVALDLDETEVARQDLIILLVS